MFTPNFIWPHKPIFKMHYTSRASLYMHGAWPWVFWLNIVENRIYLWYKYCSKLYGKLRREANFGNPVVEILTKKDEKGERNDVTMEWEKNWILVMRLPKFLLLDFYCPNRWSAWKRSALERKKPIVATKLPKFKGSEEREKRIVATKLPKMRGKKNFVVAEIVEDLIEILAIKLLQSCLSLMLQ